MKTYSLGITIEHFTREEVMERLNRLVKEMNEHGLIDCMSEHPCREEPYVPYVYVSTHEHNHPECDEKKYRELAGYREENSQWTDKILTYKDSECEKPNS